jgi:uncharacterized protein YjaZ
MDINFLKNNKQQLIQIYIKERALNSNENGALFIDFTKSKNADVYYITISKMDSKIRENIMSREKYGKDNIIYFYLFDNTNSNILEIDI